MSRDPLSDPAPHNRNRIGYWLGFVFHPFTVFVPALFVVLKDAEPLEMVGWVAFLAAIIVVPALGIIQLARQRGRYTYQRGMRHPLYLVFWLSMLFCVGLAAILNAPPRLIFALLMLCVWGPLQYLINARLTKISAHVGVITGILTTLFLMGDLNTIPLVAGAMGVICVTAWARVVTGHHTLLQVGLGAIVSVASVIIAFGLMTIM
jgi:hypothetical protein